jgi:hypothetical protein
MAAGAWRDHHESIHARLSFVHSCTADAAVQEDLRRADERQERAARNLVQSFTFGAPGVGGGHRHARRAAVAAFSGGLPQWSSYFLGQPWLRPRDPKDAGGVARLRRCPVKYKPPQRVLASFFAGLDFFDETDQDDSPPPVKSLKLV